MPTAKVTSKGQLTVPKEVRDALRIRTGDRISFQVRKDGVVEMRPATGNIKDLYGMFKYRGKRLSVEQMDEGIAEAVAESLPDVPKR